MDENTIETITRRVLQKLGEGPATGRRFPVGVSARHVHLSREHLDVLFGKGHELQVLRMLAQPGQFAAEEQVTLVGPKRTLYGVRVLGPVRSATQVEISMTDCFTVGLKAPVRDSGHHEGTVGAVLVGPAGVVQLERGVMVAARHLHVDPARASALGLEDGMRVKVRVGAGTCGRGLVFDNVLVRSGDAHMAEFHVDTDEANAAGLRNGDEVEVLF